MTGRWMIAVLVLAATITGSGAVHAQSLASVAQQSVAAQLPPGRSRVYTNADLDEIETVATPAGVGAVETSPVPAVEKKEPAVVYEEIPGAGRLNITTTTKLSDPRDETYWRTLAASLRKNLAKTNSTIAAHTAQLAELGQGSQSPSQARQREVITDTLDELSRHARAQNDEWARFITKAQMAGVPEAWVAQETLKN